MEERIRKFLQISSGSGSGDGSGDGYGDGSGFGSGDGYGDGYGDEIKKINGQDVYIVDGFATLVDVVLNNYAKGRILNSDLTTSDCYIAKYGNFFAHGKTLKDAFRDAREKYEENAPIEERIERFNREFSDRNKPILGKELFSWHHILTGSCLFGREQFCKERNLSLDKYYTVNEFIDLTENAYGKDVIEKLK